eukprot:CAMPEP_0114518998 /NCGR_PEP_ID=MMETSP0109-20121206/18751_1 /TAXON_ID=29199 /ORGANISM="Chlorarachnion reptans, Strain CCCM449" /LENGTH=70 /DNA_ID=CAMNT_0001699673 /DNA_START=58 /DNA_END=267 /DNA_ORIENTATION=-
MTDEFREQKNVIEKTENYHHTVLYQDRDEKKVASTMSTPALERFLQENRCSGLLDGLNEFEILTLDELLE